MAGSSHSTDVNFDCCEDCTRHAEDVDGKIPAPNNNTQFFGGISVDNG
jgi:hypothetical protein